MMNDLKKLENHVIQLVEMMRVSAKHFSRLEGQPQPGNKSRFEKIRFLSDIKKFHRDTAKPIGDITGIDADMLPPLKKMNDAQAAFLSDEMMRLLKAFRIFPEFPRMLPDHIKYLILCEIWKERVVHLSDSEVHLVFCNYKPFDCPYPDNYCRCNN